MFAAAERLLNALMRGDHASVEAMTPAHVRDEMMRGRQCDSGEQV